MAVKHIDADEFRRRLGPLQAKIENTLKDVISSHAVGISGAVSDEDVAVFAWAVSLALVPGV